jgi:hypothetical protein
LAGHTLALIISHHLLGGIYQGQFLSRSERERLTSRVWGCVDYLVDTLLQVTNYELGVVFPLKDDDHVDKTACWERPPTMYVRGDDVSWVRLDIAFLLIF